MIELTPQIQELIPEVIDMTSEVIELTPFVIDFTSTQLTIRTLVFYDLLQPYLRKGEQLRTKQNQIKLLFQFE